MNNNFENLEIAIAEGTKTSKKFAKNVTFTWAQFRDKLSKPVYSPETHEEFFTFDSDRQTKLKNAAGWILGGEITGTVRRDSAINFRSLITIDCEKRPGMSADHIKGVYESIKNGTNPICKFELFWHITRKHTDDSPRFRIFLPLKSHIPPSRYNPVAQIVAQIVDKTGDSFDPVSFRQGQLMFLPTCSNGQTFVSDHNKGELIDPDKILAEYGPDWSNLAKLPFSKDNMIPQTAADGVQDPYEKEGIIGAFNNLYKPIQVAIEQFLPHIYVPSTGYSPTERYTYEPGETTNGVTIQDNGRFIYSFHGTDPCAGKNHSAFDMVRVHLFGYLDKGAALKSKPENRPSFKKMLKFAGAIPEVNVANMKDIVDFPAMVNDATISEDAAPEINNEDFLLSPVARAKKKEENQRKKDKQMRERDEWIKKNLKTNPQGEIVPSLSNVILITMYDPRLKGKIAFNKFTGRIVAKQDIKTTIPTVPEIVVEDKKNGDLWKTIDDLTVQTILDWHGGKGQTGWGVSATKSQVKSAVMAVAAQEEFDPVIDYYESLVWDGTKRVSSLFTDYLGVEPDIYHKEAAELFLCAAMIRSYNPGHKFDHAIIIQGLTGTGKSTFIKELFSEEWFGELTALMTTSKDSLEQMLGKKCLELPELANMNRTALDEVKGFVTRQKDEVRLTYAERMEQWPRRCVFMGTTNLGIYLTDPDGNRRFWPIKVCVDMIDNFKLARNRDQIWAEVKTMVDKLAAKFGRLEDIVLDMTQEAKEIAKIRQENVTHENKSTPMLHFALKFLNAEEKISVITGQQIPADQDHTAIRVIASPYDIAEAIKDSAYQIIKDNVTRQVAESLKLTDEWNKPDDSNPVSYKGSKVRLYYRKGSTPEEHAVGYRIIRRVGEPEPEVN